VQDFPAAELLNGAWSLVKGQEEPVLLSRGESPMPPLDRSMPESMASAAPGPLRVRVPLLEEFPLGAWRLPFFVEDGDAPAAKARRLDETGGPAGTFVFVWHSKWPASVEALTLLRGAEAEFESRGVRVHPLSMDSVRDEDTALDRLRQAGFEGDRRGGRIGRTGTAVLNLITARTLAPYEELPLPLGLLFDAEGDLVRMSVGELDVVPLLSDAATIAAREDPTTTLPLTGGRWTSDPPTRPLADVPEKLRSLGLSELADFLEAHQ
jgi:hypothetical protein